jgi:hypothetical protein
MRRRSQALACRAAGVALLFGGLPAEAVAGAWTLEAGSGQVIATATLTTASEAFGDDPSASSTSKAELQAYVEYGITDWLTAVLAPTFERVDIDGETDAEHTGFGYTELGGRVRLLDGSAWVLSAQSTLRSPGGFDDTNPAMAGHTDPEVDVRGLFGYSLSLRDWPAFLDLQLAERFRFAEPPNEAHADLTLGVRPKPEWLLLAQSFNVFSEGSGGSDFPSYYYSKLQLSAVRELTKSLSVQFGGTTTYAGRNALQENAVLLGVWYKF